MSFADAPVLEIKSAPDEQHRTLTLDCGDGVPLTAEGVSFTFVIPDGALSGGFTFKAVDSVSGAMEKSTATDLSIVRSKLKKMGTIPYHRTSSPFLDLDEYGVYDLTGSEPLAIRTYQKGTDQLALNRAFTGNSFRIQSLHDGNAIVVGTTEQMQVGHEYTLSLTSYGQTGVEDAQVQAVLLKSSGGKLWLEDEASGRGYIIAGEL